MHAARHVAHPSVYEKARSRSEAALYCSVHLLADALPIDLIVERGLERREVEAQRYGVTVKCRSSQMRALLQ
jgi:hypothetical protein